MESKMVILHRIRQAWFAPNTKQELNKLEGQTINKLKMDGFNIINKNIAGLTRK